MHSFVQSQPNRLEGHWWRETKLSQNPLGITDTSSWCKLHCWEKCSVMLFLSEFLPSARGKEQHAALGVKGNALHPAIASLGLRNTSVYQFKRVTLSHHWSPASHMNLILLQPLWHRPRHCRNRCWVISQGPSYAYWCTLHFSGSSSVWGLCPQYIMFSGIRVWKARPLCEMLPC